MSELSKAKGKVKKGLHLPELESVSKKADEVRGSILKQVKKSGNQGISKTAEMSMALVDFQKASFDSTLTVIGELQGHSDRIITKMFSSAGWLPKEGKQLIEEWLKMGRQGRKEYVRTVDRSFDLILDFFQRVQKEHEVKAVRTAAKAGKANGKAAAKAKSPAKKKAAAKKKVALKRRAA